MPIFAPLWSKENLQRGQTATILLILLKFNSSSFSSSSSFLSFSFFGTDLLRFTEAHNQRISFSMLVKALGRKYEHLLRNLKWCKGTTWLRTNLSDSTSKVRNYHPSIHLWRYSPFWALASLTRRFHSSLFVALLLHPLVPSSCSASLWTTSAHLVLALPTGLVVWKFPFRIFFGILSSSILIIWPAHYSLLIVMSSTMFGSLYKL